MTKIRPFHEAEVRLEIRLNQTRTREESRQRYENVYGAGDISQSESLYMWLLDLLNLDSNERYLDISCGLGELPYYAKKQIPMAHGMDLSHNALVKGQGKFQLDRLVTANSEQLPYADESFDVISSIGSLEHYVDMAVAVREKARVLKIDGRALILVPNTFSLLSNIWIAFRQGKTAVDPYQPIQRYLARYEWQALLEDNGLVVERTIKYEREWPRTRRDMLNYLRRPKEMIRLILTPFIPLNLAWSFVFFCRKQGPSNIL
ncbi:MAG: ubiquinone/menaquinone biosynthesis C-methylase UbiE [Cellvibrionaceae bacterium]|jgi:ubiquinone/menaquinone biosynthesis C-methylase UbiE